MHASASRHSTELSKRNLFHVQKQHHLHRRHVSCALIHDVNSRMDKRDRRFPRTRISSLAFLVSGTVLSVLGAATGNIYGQKVSRNHYHGFQLDRAWMGRVESAIFSSFSNYYPLPAPLHTSWLAGCTSSLFRSLTQASQALANTALGHLMAPAWLLWRC